MKSMLFFAGAAFAAILSASQAGSPAQAQSAPDGAAVFKQRCASCHALSGKGGKVGPDLTGVVGRRAGSTAYAYSAAMKGSSLVWDAKALDAYLAAPSNTVPGTKMVIGVSKPDDRKAIIVLLATSGS